MKTESEHGKLLSDLLAENDLRAATLQAGLTAMRRRRFRRQLTRAVALLVAPILVAMIAYRMSIQPRTQRAPAVAQAPQVVPGTNIRVLTDEQLLDLFKGRPVALIGPPGNQQLLLLDQSA